MDAEDFDEMLDSVKENFAKSAGGGATPDEIKALKRDLTKATREKDKAVKELDALTTQLAEEKNIRIWSAPSGVTFIEPSHNQHRKNAELIRETFIASLNPDIVLITSLFEGLVDDAVTSVGLMNYSIPTAVILYDLIPLINSKPYLDNPDAKRWYEEKIEHLKRADLLLSISESSKQEAIKYLKFSDNNVVNISTASDSQFKKIELSENQKNEVLKKYHFNKEFLMYTGGIDHRKNIEGLIRSYAFVS